MVARACNPSYSGGCDRTIALTQEAEIAVSGDHSTALQPGQQGEALSQNKIKSSTIIQYDNVSSACYSQCASLLGQTTISEFGIWYFFWLKN